MVLTATEESPEFQHQYDVGLARANRTFSFIDLSMAVVAPILVGLICDSVFWKKDGDFGPTRYYDSEGKEVMLNKGKTWICIVGADRFDKAEIYGK